MKASESKFALETLRDLLWRLFQPASQHPRRHVLVRKLAVKMICRSQVQNPLVVWEKNRTRSKHMSCKSTHGLGKLSCKVKQNRKANTLTGISCSVPQAFCNSVAPSASLNFTLIPCNVAVMANTMTTSSRRLFFS